MNDVTRFMYYMYNRWCYNEALSIFGPEHGKYVFDKWCECNERRQDDLRFYALLDDDSKNQLVNRAKEVYK